MKVMILNYSIPFSWPVPLKREYLVSDRPAGTSGGKLCAETLNTIMNLVEILTVTIIPIIRKASTTLNNLMVIVLFAHVSRKYWLMSNSVDPGQAI